MATIVIPDTNIFVSAPRVDIPAWSSLIEHRHDWNLRIVVPELVVIETINVLKREWLGAKHRVASINLSPFGLEHKKDEILNGIDEQIDAYETQLRERLTEIGAEITPIPPVGHLDIARRASEGRAPYTAKDKDGYRDTLIWHTVTEIARTNPDAEVWFVSANHTDFGPKPPHWTGENEGERDDCPIQFHADLRAELQDLGLAHHVRYVLSVQRLDQHIAAKFAPIDDADLTHRAQNIDISTLAAQLIDASFGLHLNPREAALPLETVLATILGAQRPLTGWRFHEGAGRGDAGWTARFAVSTEVDIAASVDDSPPSTEVQTKTLTLVGDIAVSPENEILDLTVTGGESLPDDPMRERWTRHDQLMSATGRSDQLWPRYASAAPSFSGHLPQFKFDVGSSQAISEFSRAMDLNTFNTFKPDLTTINRFTYPELSKITDSFKPDFSQLISGFQANLDTFTRGSMAQMAELLSNQNLRLAEFVSEQSTLTSGFVNWAARSRETISAETEQQKILPDNGSTDCESPDTDCETDQRHEP
ncbi:PIN domain-containing protein [Mycobacteroides franklinii]|nr:PIN domain-containing protein [Mycobacteroides franklinii]